MPRCLLLALLPSILLLLGCGSDEMSTPPADSSPPTVTLHGPPPGAVTGLVTLTASAHDENGIKSVRFRVNGSSTIATDTSPPFNYVWDTGSYAPGTYTWEAIAFDPAGNSTGSESVTWTVGI